MVRVNSGQVKLQPREAEDKRAGIVPEASEPTEAARDGTTAATPLTPPAIAGKVNA